MSDVSTVSNAGKALATKELTFKFRAASAGGVARPPLTATLAVPVVTDLNLTDSRTIDWLNGLIESATMDIYRSQIRNNEDLVSVTLEDLISSSANSGGISADVFNNFADLLNKWLRQGKGLAGDPVTLLVANCRKRFAKSGTLQTALLESWSRVLSAFLMSDESIIEQFEDAAQVLNKNLLKAIEDSQSASSDPFAAFSQ